MLASTMILACRPAWITCVRTTPRLRMPTRWRWWPMPWQPRLKKKVNWIVSPAACWTGWPTWPIRKAMSATGPRILPPCGWRGSIRQHRNHRPGHPGLATFQYPPGPGQQSLALPGARQGFIRYLVQHPGHRALAQGAARSARNSSQLTDAQVTITLNGGKEPVPCK